MAAPDEKQIVEILKAICSDPRLLILDEATASLDSRQVQRLFELVERWKEEGKAIVFVSHRMEEIFRIADRYSRAAQRHDGRGGADERYHRARHGHPDGRAKRRPRTVAGERATAGSGRPRARCQLEVDDLRTRRAAKA